MSTAPDLNRAILRHLLALRQPNGWPVIGADQFLEDLVDGEAAREYRIETDDMWAYTRGGEVYSTAMLVIGGRIFYAYRMVLGITPLRGSVAFPSDAIEHPDWLWAKPAPYWLSPAVPIAYEANKRLHYLTWTPDKLPDYLRRDTIIEVPKWPTT